MVSSQRTKWGKRADGGQWLNLHTCPWTGKGRGDYRCGVLVRDGRVDGWHCFHNYKPTRAEAEAVYSGTAAPVGRPDRPLPTSPTEDRDAVYRAILSGSKLTEAHRQHLIGRGMTDAEIERGGYTSAPTAERARELAMTAGVRRWYNVPGLRWRKQTDDNPSPIRWPYAPDAILIPVKNRGGSVTGLRFRWLDGGGPNGAKYSPPAGSVAANLIHCAWPRSPQPGAEWWITEGEIKANILASRRGVFALSVPGVGAWRAPGVNLWRIMPAKSAAVVAFDADAATNAEVAKQAIAAARAGEVAGHSVRMAWWDGTRAKGADDAIMAGLPIELLSIDEWIGRLPPETRAAIMPNIDARKRWAWQAVTPTAAPTTHGRQHHADATRQAVKRWIADRPRGVTLLRTPTGAGKSRAIAEYLVRGHEAGTLPGSVLVLVRSHEAAAELLAHQVPGTNTQLADIAHHVFGAMTPEQAQERADELRGRVTRGGREYYADEFWRQWVCRNPERDAASKARHNATAEVCASCPLASDCLFPQASKRLASGDGLPVVVAVYGSYLNEADRIGEYGAIVVDEDPLTAMVDTFTVTAEDLLTIAEAMRAARADDVHLDALAALRAVVDKRPQATDEDRHPSRTIDREAADELGILAPVLASLDALADAGAEWERRRVAPWERIQRGRAILPRWWADLTDAVTGRGYGGAVAELTPDGLVVTIPRRKVLASMRRAAWLVADATPSVKLWREICPDVAIVGNGTAVPVTVTQVIGGPSLAGKLSGDSTAAERARQRRQRLAEAAMAAVADGGSVAPLLVARKDNEKRTEWLDARRRPAPVAVWGRDTKGSNAYRDCDAVILVDHYQPNIGATARKVRALRQSVPVAGETVTRPVPVALIGADVVPATERPIHPDPLTRAVIEAEHLAEVMQAIGRARPLDKSAPAPVPVWILPSLPVPGLAVTRAVLADELDPPDTSHLAEPGHGCTDEQLAKRAEAVAMVASGHSLRVAAEAVGVHHSTVAKWCRQSGQIGVNASTEADEETLASLSAPSPYISINGDPTDSDATPTVPPIVTGDTAGLATETATVRVVNPDPVRIMTAAEFLVEAAAYTAAHARRRQAPPVVTQAAPDVPTPQTPRRPVGLPAGLLIVQSTRQAVPIRPRKVQRYAVTACGEWTPLSDPYAGVG